MSSQPVIYCLLPRTAIISMSVMIGCWELIKCFFFFFGFRNTFKQKTFFYIISDLGRIITLLSAFGFFYSSYLAYKRRFKPYNRLLHLFTANLVFDAYSLIWTISNAFLSNIERDSTRDDLSEKMMSRRGANYTALTNSTTYNKAGSGLYSKIFNGTFFNGTLDDGMTYNATMINQTFLSGIMSNGTVFNRTVTAINIDRTGNGTITKEYADTTANIMANSLYIVLPTIMCLFFLIPFINKLYFVSKINAYVKYVLYKKEESQTPAIQVQHKLPECSQ